MTSRTDFQGWKVLEGEFGQLIGAPTSAQQGTERYTQDGKYYLTTLMYL